MSKDIFKFELLYKSTLNNPNEINDKNPISKLISNFEEIKTIINGKNPNIIKLLYFNKNQIHTILYESEELITLKTKLMENNISNYFYLILLLKDNENMVNYEYSIDFIRNINKELNNKNNNNNNNNIFENIIISKLIIDLIDNYKGLENYEEKEEEEELKKIENYNINNIKNNLNELNKKIEMDLELDEKILKRNKIDKIYINILKILIEKHKIDDYEFTIKIIKELDLENIYLTKTMFNELKIILNKDNIRKYKISEKEDLLDNNKINFYFILFKYILKNPIYIYYIPFLLETKNKIIKLIKHNSIEYLFNNINDKIKNKLDEIFKFIVDSNYYIKKDLNISTHNYNELNIKNKNSHINDSEMLSRTSIASHSTNQTISVNQQNQNVDDDNYFKILQFEKTIDINEKTEQKYSVKYIREMSNGLFFIGGQKDTINIYDKDFHFKKTLKFPVITKIKENQNKNNDDKKNQYEIVKNPQNIIETSQSISNNNNRSIEVLDCSRQGLMLYNIIITNNRSLDRSGQKQFEIPCTGCYEKIKNNKIEYVVVGEKGIYHFEDFPSTLKIENKEKLDDYNKDKRNYKGSIKINENIIALTSNSILPRGEDIIVFYDMNNQKIIKSYKKDYYSFISGVNGLIIMDLEKENKKKKVLLCACKKYTKKQKNGILIIDTEIEESKEKYVDLDSFEINCLCQIYINKKNTNYFFIGGLDTDKRKGIIKLCKLIYINNEFNIEILEDVFICNDKDDRDFEGFKSPINNIIQSKNNGKILVGCGDGKVYFYSEPNINYYLEDDKEYNEFY